MGEVGQDISERGMAFNFITKLKGPKKLQEEGQKAPRLLQMVSISL
jgi:hypothetical protein